MNARIVLAALDRSEHSSVSLPIAKGLAALEGASLHIVHVAERILPPVEILDRLGLDPDALHGTVLNPRSGEPAHAIIRAAEEVDARAIVMCTHTAVAHPGHPLGTTALGVLFGAPCPVVLVHPERGASPWSLDRILLPHDGTATTSAAIRPAADLARKSGAEISVLNVATGRPPDREALSPPRYVDDPHHEWQAWAGEFLERLECICPLEGLRVRMTLASGTPAEEIVGFAAAHTIDLIVLAWRGRWEDERAAILKAVARDAPCPTMIVRARSDLGG